MRAEIPSIRPVTIESAFGSLDHGHWLASRRFTDLNGVALQRWAGHAFGPQFPQREKRELSFCIAVSNRLPQKDAPLGYYNCFSADGPLAEALAAGIGLQRFRRLHNS
jgi:hypothetical protein